MDTIPFDYEPATTEQHYKEAQDDSNFIRWFANRTGEEGVLDLTRPYIEKGPQVIKWLGHLARNHSPLRYSGGMVLFRAMIQEDSTRQPISPAEWKPYIKGEIEVYDIKCIHVNMDQPAPLAEIGGVLAQKLDE
ncbi:hypothetical protein BGZ65_013001, partial [Modicella reniformis]